MESYSTWTIEQNKRFENALSDYENFENPEFDYPYFFEELAKTVGGKTVEEIKIHYKELVEDLKLIEDGFPLYYNLSMDCPQEPEDQESSTEEEKPIRSSKKANK